MENLEKIVFIGTGCAMAYEAFNTCIGFMDKNNECFLIDAGGGNGIKIGFCGDVPLLKQNFSVLKNVDILIHEALCDSKNSEKYKVYKKGHSTAKDAGKVAKEVSAKSLVLIHKADDFINSSALYNDASLEFSGNIIVPEDGEVLKFADI